MDNAEGASTYYYSEGKRIPLIVESDQFTVKFKPGIRSDSTALMEQSRRILRDESSNVDFLASYGMYVYRSPAALDKVQQLGQDQSVEFATPAVRIPGNPNQAFLTDQLSVQFKSDIDEQQVEATCRRFGLEVVEKLGFVDNGYLLKVQSPTEPLASLRAANALQESGLTRFAHPDFVYQRHIRSVAGILPVARDAPTGTPAATGGGDGSPERWHLEMARVVQAWAIPGLAEPRGTASIAIGILDDGIDVTHPEFAGTVSGGQPKIKAQFDFATKSADATPKTAEENHGTACAGIATAAGLRYSGVAPGCRLIAARAPEFLGVVDEARMFAWAADNGADVISCSWGGPDGINAVQPLSDTTRAAIHYCVTSGRGGKGIPIVWAAGNGNESLEKNGQPRDGYACNPEVMAIGASTSRELRAWYSDFGPELWVCAPSSGDRNAGEQAIFTVDRSGASGYNPGAADKGGADGNYTNDFGGTSAAAPLVAGIVALMLSANPSLSRTEVRDMLKTSAEKIGDGYDASGHSDSFGYGRVDAYRAVQAAIAGPAAAGGPSIQGPAAVGEADGPPTFQVDPRPNGYYAVEVATRAELFDAGGHGGERTADNFYGSWQDGAALSAPSYTLPDPVWRRLRSARRLYYRACTTASPSGWSNPQATTPASRPQNAPAIQIIAAGPAAAAASNGSAPATALRSAPTTEMGRRVSRRDVPTPPTGSTGEAPTISGPSTFRRDSAVAPGFSIDPGANGFYGVEVATDPGLFLRSRAGERTSANFFGSWQTGLVAAHGSSSYWLPDDAWRALRPAARLYYRAVSASANDPSWPNFQTSVPADQADTAPFIDLIGRSDQRDKSLPIRPDEDLWRRRPTGR